jgi:uncharacterized protein (DUF488 family)
VVTVWTIGHGQRATGELLATLRGHHLQLLVDVRRFPASRRHPHLARAPLEAALPAAGIAYSWRGDVLGGRRKAPDHPTRHPAWRVESFRHYADWMDGPEFQAALAALEQDAARVPLAVMCAETLWWRCHRRLIADALVARGHRVLHIMGDGMTQEHRLHEAARVEGGRPVYDLAARGG